MFIYETDGFLEVESKEIKQLCRSTGYVTLGDAEDSAYEVQAVLCDYMDNSRQRCRVAFYARALKQAVVFTIKGSEKQSSWQHGQETLAFLDFQLDEVNLKLSPAMLEVVLRDVPGLLTPAEARKQRTEKALLLSELQEIYDKNPHNAHGKKAALKLNAEKRLNDRCEELRLLLEELFVSGEAVRADLEALASQVKDLTLRLESASALAESESNRRQLSESITAAAEKRIQELEEILVDFETISSDKLKQKRQSVQLQRRINELGEELSAVEVELETERGKQEQFIADVNAAHDRISLLENELKESLTSLGDIRAQLTEEKAEKTQLNERLSAAELHNKALDQELLSALGKTAQSDEELKASEDVQAQLAETVQALKDALKLNNALEEELTAASEQSEGLRDKLHEAEKAVIDRARDKEQIINLTEKREQLDRELKELRDEYAQECTLRKRLEKGAVGDERHIRELEASLANVTDNISELSVGESGSEEVAREVDSLKLELLEQKQRFNEERMCREELEEEVGEAHKLIDSLEKMIRETESAAAERLSYEASASGGNQKVQELLTQLQTVENQLEQERIEQKRLAKAVFAAERKITEQAEQLVRGQTRQVDQKIQAVAGTETLAPDRMKSAKSLPHELRPAPKKGVLFHPDWDLEGLPCQTSSQVSQAWETVFNVQISLEGYPAQYCMAFLVVLEVEEEKQLYMLYRLKNSKHTLVCVPAIIPDDGPSLKKSVKEGLKFLKKSGFEMEEMSAEHIDSTLTPYFLGA